MEKSAKSKVVAFLPNHPSQIWMLKPVADWLESKGTVIVKWYIRDKDVSLSLAKSLGLDFVVLSKAGKGILGNAWELFLNIFRCLSETRKERVDLWLSKYGCATIAARILGRRAIGFNDDDADVVPLIAATCYPFAHSVLVPTVTRMGRYESKADRYPSSHELFYLHPNRFRPDQSIFELLGLTPGSPYAILRLSALQAHHDVGIEGVSDQVVRALVELCNELQLRLFITSEKPIKKEWEPYRLTIPPVRIHEALSHAEFLVGDSQTMTAEAATLGVPAFRLSDFYGKISYITELERFELAFGYFPADWKKMFEDIRHLLANPERKQLMQMRLQRFLNAKIDPVPRFGQAILSTLGNPR
jgi:predicted glycosyltransferase